MARLGYYCWFMDKLTVSNCRVFNMLKRSLSLDDSFFYVNLTYGIIYCDLWPPHKSFLSFWFAHPGDSYFLFSLVQASDNIINRPELNASYSILPFSFLFSKTDGLMQTDNFFCQVCFLINCVVSDRKGLMSLNFSYLFIWAVKGLDSRLLRSIIEDYTTKTPFCVFDKTVHKKIYHHAIVSPKRQNNNRTKLAISDNSITLANSNKFSM